MGVDEYSWQVRNQSDPSVRCVFDQQPGQIRDEMISLSRLFKTGEYLGSRLMNQEKTVAGTVIQGDGMADRRVSSDDANGSLSDRVFLAGLMNSSELIDLVGAGLNGSA